MQNEGAGILGLLLALIAIFALIVLIGLILYGAAVYYAGRHLRIQLTQRYKLTKTSALALVGVGLVMLALSVLAPSLTFLWLLLFLGAAILIIELWALAKCWPYLRDIRRQRSKAREYSDQLKGVRQQMDELSQRIRHLEEHYGRPLREQEELEQILRALCHWDAENLTLKCRQHQQEFAKLTSAELRRAKSEAIAQAKAQKHSEKQIHFTLKASLLRLEELERLVGEKGEALRKNRYALECKTHEEQELRQKLLAAQQELARLESTYQAFRASRIALD